MKRFAILLTAAALLFSAAPVLAQGNNPPPVDPNSVWGEVVNPDGTINYGNLNDKGIVKESADWMPTIPLIGSVQAEYHVYETPSGNVVQLPSATTLLFMALNPRESGIGDASSSLYTGLGTALTAPGIISAMLQGANIDLPGAGYVNTNQFADALIAGKTDIWSLPAGDVFNLVMNLVNMSAADSNLYTALLLYTPDSIPAEFADLFGDDTPLVLPDPPRCPAPVVTPGRISTQGELAAPNYPLVVGQDPDKRGVDLLFTASVAPTIYTYWVEVPITEEECRALRYDGQVSDCTRPNGLPGRLKDVIVGWECEKRQQAYPETISMAYGEIRLTQESKNWILDTLSIRYPGAYVHHPKFTWPASGSGSSTWTYSAQHALVADPGKWDIIVAGQTSGTPVSAARAFGGPAGQFNVWLKETAIVR